MRRRARTDANHAEIRQALRKCGWIVLDTARVGDGFPDLVCYRAGDLRLVEVKVGKSKLTADQVKFHAGVPVTILRTVEDVAALR